MRILVSMARIIDFTVSTVVVQTSECRNVYGFPHSATGRWINVASQTYRNHIVYPPQNKAN
jgi:hypothetical protein